MLRHRDSGAYSWTALLGVSHVHGRLAVLADVHTVRMRWFGPEFDSGDLDQIAVVASYHNHVAKLRAKVASSIQELTRINLHDGLVRAWELEGDTFG